MSKLQALIDWMEERINYLNDCGVRSELGIVRKYAKELQKQEEGWVSVEENGICDFCHGDGIYIDGDNNRLECPACINGRKPSESKEEGWISVEDNIWKIGNKLRITTVFDYEERKDFPNHNEYENLGKQIYCGEVTVVDKGLALKTDDGKIFKTQGSYWFGSILEQNIELI